MSEPIQTTKLISAERWVDAFLDLHTPEPKVEERAEITIPAPIVSLLRDAAHLLDTAFCFSDDERLDRRYTETRDRIREALKHVRT